MDADGKLERGLSSTHGLEQGKAKEPLGTEGKKELDPGSSSKAPESNTKAYIIALVIYLVELGLMINALLADIQVVKELTNWDGFRGRYDVANTAMPVSGPSDLSIERGFLIFACAASGMVICLSTMNAFNTAYGKARQAMLKAKVAPGDTQSLAAAEDKVQSMANSSSSYMMGYSIFINNVCIAYYKLIVYGSILNKLSFYGLYCHTSDSQAFAQLSGVIMQQVHLGDGTADASGCVNDPFAGVMQTAIIMTLAVLPFSSIWYQAASANENLKIQLLLIPSALVSIVLNLLLPVATGMMFIGLQYQQIKNGWFEMDTLLIRAIVASLMALCVACINVLVTSLVLNRVIKISKDKDPSLEQMFGEGKRQVPDRSDSSSRPAPVAEALEPGGRPPSPSGRDSASQLGRETKKGLHEEAAGAEEGQDTPQASAVDAAGEQAPAGQAEETSAGDGGLDLLDRDCKEPGLSQKMKLCTVIVFRAVAWVIGINLSIGQFMCLMNAASPLALDVALRTQNQDPASGAWSFWFVISYAFSIFSMVLAAAFLCSLFTPFMQGKIAEVVESAEATVGDVGEAAARVNEAKEEEKVVQENRAKITAGVIEKLTASGASREAAALVARAVLDALTAAEHAKQAQAAAGFAADAEGKSPEAAALALAAKAAAETAAQAAEASDQAVAEALAAAQSSLEETAAAADRAAAAAATALEAAGEASRAAVLCLA